MGNRDTMLLFQRPILLIENNGPVKFKGHLCHQTTGRLSHVFFPLSPFHILPHSCSLSSAKMRVLNCTKQVTTLKVTKSMPTQNEMKMFEVHSHWECLLDFSSEEKLVVSNSEATIAL